MRALVTNVAKDAGLVAVASLAAAGYEVFGADRRRLPFGLRSRLLAGSFVLDDSSEETFDRDLLAAIERVRPELVLPIETRAARTVVRNRHRLPAGVRVNLPSAAAFETAYDKGRCAAECRRFGVPTPAVYDLAEALERVGAGDGALVVKPAADLGAAEGVRIVSSAPELRRTFEACRERYGEALIQEHIPGPADAMCAATLLFSAESRLVAAFTLRKLRHWPATGGLTVVGVSTADERLVAPLLPLFEAWSWRGAAEIEWKEDSRDGRFRLIEVNPRFPAYLRLPGQCGLDLPALAAGLAAGREPGGPLAFPSYRRGVKFLNPGLFVRSVARELRDGVRPAAQTLRAAIGEARGSGRGVAAMLADPLPLLGRTLDDLRRGIGDR